MGPKAALSPSTHLQGLMLVVTIQQVLQPFLRGLAMVPQPWQPCLESLYWQQQSLQFWAGLCHSLNASVPMHAVRCHSDTTCKLVVSRYSEGCVLKFHLCRRHLPLCLFFCFHTGQPKLAPCENCRTKTNPTEVPWCCHAGLEGRWGGGCCSEGAPSYCASYPCCWDPRRSSVPWLTS